MGCFMSKIDHRETSTPVIPKDSAASKVIPSSQSLSSLTTSASQTTVKIVSVDGSTPNAGASPIVINVFVNGSTPNTASDTNNNILVDGSTGILSAIDTDNSVLVDGSTANPCASDADKVVSVDSSTPNPRASDADNVVLLDGSARNPTSVSDANNSVSVDGSTANPSASDAEQVVLVDDPTPNLSASDGENRITVDGSTANPTSASDTASDTASDNPHPDLIPSSLRRFPFAELQAATNSFHPQNEIGRGGFGVVYKGVIPPGPNGLGPEPTEVAIKRMREANEGYEEAFKREVIVLGRLSHPHLVRLHGYCMERDEALLVYEFMTGGSLDKALLDSASGELVFSWSTRLKVAVQVADALAFLHGRNLIHRDIKAANVLLSPEYDAKVTDFGMVRGGPEGQLQSIVATRIMGTRGYSDPSYMETGHLGPKSDIYSFGVLLFELVTGRRVAQEEERVVDECKTRFARGNPSAAGYIDPRLGNPRPVQSALRLAILARFCVMENRSNRPDIGEIRRFLREIVEAHENDVANAAATG